MFSLPAAPNGNVCHNGAATRTQGPSFTGHQTEGRCPHQVNKGAIENRPVPAGWLGVCIYLFSLQEQTGPRRENIELSRGTMPVISWRVGRAVGSSRPASVTSPRPVSPGLAADRANASLWAARAPGLQLLSRWATWALFHQPSKQERSSVVLCQEPEGGTAGTEALHRCSEDCSRTQAHRGPIPQRQ